MILLTGAGGQLGRELSGCLGVLGKVAPLSTADLDFSAPDLEERLSKRSFPDLQAVVNAAAYTAVDLAESEEAKASLVNSKAPAILAALADRHGVPFIHYSTDYVYDGSKAGPYTEEDPTGPLNAYGRTKLEGDRLVAKAAEKHLIFRTSWVFSQTGACFPRTVLRLAREKESLLMDRTQKGAPTSTEHIAAVTLVALRAVLSEGREPWGLYHLAAGGETTWYGFSRYLLEKARDLSLDLKLTPDGITPRDTEDLSRAARRPLNSTLSTFKLREVFGLELPDWTFHAERFVRGVKIQSGLL
jgi:dTDP-4-dehydrorhamnose reductase